MSATNLGPSVEGKKFLSCWIVVLEEGKLSAGRKLSVLVSAINLYFASGL